eukprot:2794489-Rhodomonas_salina.4
MGKQGKLKLRLRSSDPTERNEGPWCAFRQHMQVVLYPVYLCLLSRVARTLVGSLPLHFQQDARTFDSVFRINSLHGCCVCTAHVRSSFVFGQSEFEESSEKSNSLFSSLQQIRILEFILEDRDKMAMGPQLVHPKVP